MTKFVLASHSTLSLNAQHVNWLRNNGYPNADRRFCSELCHGDRSNPVLISCVEAVREAGLSHVEQAVVMQQHEYELIVAAKADTQKLAAAIHAVVEAVRADGKNYSEMDILADMLCRLRNQVCRFDFEATDAVWEEFLNCLKLPTFAAIREAYDEIEHFCCDNGLYRSCERVIRKDFFDYDRAWTSCDWEEVVDMYRFCRTHGLVGCDYTFEVNDGVTIETFDETRFIATVREEEFLNDWDGSICVREEMELTPYFSRAAINSFVANGDTDGLLAYLQSLNSNISIKG